jgi:hypothetical protein
VVSIPGQIGQADCSRVHAALTQAPQPRATVIVDLTKPDFCGHDAIVTLVSVQGLAAQAGPGSGWQPPHSLARGAGGGADVRGAGGSWRADSRGRSGAGVVGGSAFTGTGIPQVRRARPGSRQTMRGDVSAKGPIGMTGHFGMRATPFLSAYAPAVAVEDVTAPLSPLMGRPSGSTVAPGDL